MKLRDQKRMYQDRIQEIWRRQRAALSADAVTRGVGEAGEVAEGDEGKEAAAVDKKLDEEMKAAESDDSDDDDDLARLKPFGRSNRVRNRRTAADLSQDFGAVQAQSLALASRQDHRLHRRRGHHRKLKIKPCVRRPRHSGSAMWLAPRVD